MNAHNITGIQKSNIYQMNAIYHTYLRCATYKIIINWNYRHTNVISIRNRYQILEIPTILGFLCNYNQVDPSLLENIMEIPHGSKIILHIRSRFIGQISQVTHGSGMFCQNIPVESMSHRAAPNNNYLCFNIVLQHIPCGNFVERHPLDNDKDDRKHVEYSQQQPRKLRQSEDKQKCCHQRKANQICDSDFNQFSFSRANM